MITEQNWKRRHQMKIRYDTYCGLYCGACAVLIANETDEV